MSSSLLEGKVRHRRAHPVAYALEHDVWYPALDLDELPATLDRLRLVRRTGRGVLELRDADHLVEPAADLARDVRTHLAREGIDAEAWSIVLVTNLRVLGYQFNPASFFLCSDRGGTLRVVVVEVHNTFGERHLYTLRRAGNGGPFRAAMDKAFYVSPFLDLDGSYAVHVRDEPEGLRIAITERRDDEPVLSTSLVLRRLPLTDRNLLRMLLRHPLVTHKTIAAIHWHALRLRLRGARWHPHAAAGR